MAIPLCTRLTLLATALLVTSPSVAGWIAVGGNDHITAYVDSATIRKAGTKAKMWDILDYKSPKTIEGNTFLSLKSQKEYDCKEEQSRKLVFTSHSENMGKGNVVYTNSEPKEWESVRPDTINEILWSIACGK